MLNREASLLLSSTSTFEMGRIQFCSDSRTTSTAECAPVSPAGSSADVRARASAGTEFLEYIYRPQGAESQWKTLQVWNGLGYTNQQILAERKHTQTEENREKI